MNFASYSSDLWSPGGEQLDRGMRRVYGAGTTPQLPMPPGAAEERERRQQLDLGLINLLKECMTEIRTLKEDVSRIDSVRSNSGTANDLGGGGVNNTLFGLNLGGIGSIAALTSLVKTALLVVVGFLALLLVLVVALVIAVLVVSSSRREPHYVPMGMVPASSARRLQAPSAPELPPWRW
jgi:hypothetical protein